VRRMVYRTATLPTLPVVLRGVVAVGPRGFAGIDFMAADVWVPLGSRARAAYGVEWKTGAVFLQVICSASRARSLSPCVCA
jgi:hypothetical protein